MLYFSFLIADLDILLGAAFSLGRANALRTRITAFLRSSEGSGGTWPDISHECTECDVKSEDNALFSQHISSALPDAAMCVPLELLRDLAPGVRFFDERQLR